MYTPEFLGESSEFLEESSEFLEESSEFLEESSDFWEASSEFLEESSDFWRRALYFWRRALQNPTGTNLALRKKIRGEDGNTDREPGIFGGGLWKTSGTLAAPMAPSTARLAG